MTREEEEHFNRITQENQELKERIIEKERQIEQIKAKIDALAEEQVELKKKESENKQLSIK